MMSWHPSTWPTLTMRLHQPSGQWLTSLREYFRYHGVYAPMVRFMRQVDFRYKSLLVAGTFALPVSIVLSLQFQTEWRHERQLADQVLGWEHLLRVNDMQTALSLQALVPEDAAPHSTLGTSQLEQAYQALTQWRDRHPHEAGPASTWQALDEAYVSWQEGQSGTPARRIQRAQGLNHALKQLEQAVTRQTGLGLTLDAHVHAMINLSTNAWPEVIDQLSWRLQSMASAPQDNGASVSAPSQSGLPLTHLESALLRLDVAIQEVGQDGPNVCAPSAGGTDWRALTQAVVQASQDASGQAWLNTQPRLLRAQQEAGEIRQQCLGALEEATDRQLGDQKARLAALGTIMGLGMLLAAYTMVAFSRVMRGGMHIIQREVERMAQGDLSGRTLPLGEDEVAITLHSLRRSLLRLADLFTVVRRGVASVSHASGDISSASESLTSKILEASNAVDAMHAGVGTTLSYLESNQQCVGQAVSCAREMSADAGRSRRAMNRLAEVIEGLQQSSREIEKFVSLIDGIAFQTNLLALNASVEAAKAGASGKGFAVVAAEVRGLANRVAEAAAQISRVVDGSTSQIGLGQEIARGTVDAVRSTETHVNEMNRILGRLAQITDDGRGNAEQMTATLQAVHSNSQQTQTLVVQVEQAAKELRQQSLKLAEQASRFKLG